MRAIFPEVSDLDSFCNIKVTFKSPRATYPVSLPKYVLILYCFRIILTYSPNITENTAKERYYYSCIGHVMFRRWP